MALIALKLTERVVQNTAFCPALVKAFTGVCTTRRLFCTMATVGETHLKEFADSVIPALTHSMHKGQAGRIAVIGGCKEYTGAPYFAAISALKAGADLSHVFCTDGAAPVIKSYSPELIVHPVLDASNSVSEILQWLPRFHALVVGPGLGREDHILNTTGTVIQEAKERKIPIVIDADGLYLVTQNHAVIQGYEGAILTPNVAEFGRLYKKMISKEPEADDPVAAVKQLCQELGCVTIVHKGHTDIISNGDQALTYASGGSPRRCGGQGDLLSGSMGLFAAWANILHDQISASTGSDRTIYQPGIKAACLASALTRECSKRAFQHCGRSMMTSDMIAQIHKAFDHLFS